VTCCAAATAQLIFLAFHRCAWVRSWLSNAKQVSISLKLVAARAQHLRMPSPSFAGARLTDGRDALFRRRRPLLRLVQLDTADAMALVGPKPDGLRQLLSSVGNISEPTRTDDGSSRRS
jgi:hypothetical protein